VTEPPLSDAVVPLPLPPVYDAKLAERYLTVNTAALATEVLVVLRPERWWSVDFAKLDLG